MNLYGTKKFTRQSEQMHILLNLVENGYNLVFDELPLSAVYLKKLRLKGKECLASRAFTEDKKEGAHFVN